MINCWVGAGACTVCGALWVGIHRHEAMRQTIGKVSRIATCTCSEGLLRVADSVGDAADPFRSAGVELFDLGVHTLLICLGGHDVVDVFLERPHLSRHRRSRTRWCRAAQATPCRAVPCLRA